VEEALKFLTGGPWPMGDENDSGGGGRKTGSPAAWASDFFACLCWDRIEACGRGSLIMTGMGRTLVQEEFGPHASTS